MRKKTILLLVLVPVVLMAQAEKKQDVWEPMKFLLGQWEGKGDGKSGISKVWKEWHFVLNGKFLNMKTKAVFEPQEKNPKGETHEDLGYFRLPFWGCYTLDGKDLETSGGVEPDIFVINDLNHDLTNQDSQLDKAIEMALELIKK